MHRLVVLVISHALIIEYKTIPKLTARLQLEDLAKCSWYEIKNWSPPLFSFQAVDGRKDYKIIPHPSINK
jgi:hypothetical protein